MEESLRRVNPAFIEAASPYLGYVRGMHAFALGECDRFDEAQARTVFLLFAPCWLWSPSVFWVLFLVCIRLWELSVAVDLPRFLRSSADPIVVTAGHFEPSAFLASFSNTPLSFSAVCAAD